MARLCERPGCSQPADVMYGIEAENLTVWIEPFDRGTVARAGVLCLRHADSMVVPLGWMLDDRREPAPRLFKSKPVETPAPTAKQKRARTHHRRDDSQQLQLDDTAPPTRRRAARRAEPDGPELPWKPVFDQEDNLDGLLEANSPLLARAFRGRNKQEPQH